MFVPEKESFNQQVFIEKKYNVTLHVKREDVLHSEISGNKFRKLKYNLETAKNQKKNRILTFGGAYSNHIAAVAAAGRIYGFQTIGVIRGDELATKFMDNPTLRKAFKDGMQFQFVTRTQYRNKDKRFFQDSLVNKWGDFYLIPEGGTNNLAIKGTQEILTELDETFDYICCSVGTGGTIAGIINTLKPHQKALGFPALKGGFLKSEIEKHVTNQQWELINNYHFGGYAKVTEELREFIQKFYQKNFISLEPIYTGKMLFGISDLIQKKHFLQNSKILAIHTGGLQGLKSNM